MNRASEKLILKKGTEIVCHHCRLYLGRLRKDLKMLDRLKSDLFEGPNISAFGKMRCPRCSALWYVNSLGRIHTRNGWWPEDDVMMDLKDGIYNIDY